MCPPQSEPPSPAIGWDAASAVWVTERPFSLAHCPVSKWIRGSDNARIVRSSDPKGPKIRSKTGFLSDPEAIFETEMGQWNCLKPNEKSHLQLSL